MITRKKNQCLCLCTLSRFLPIVFLCFLWIGSTSFPIDSSTSYYFIGISSKNSFFSSPCISSSIAGSTDRLLCRAYYSLVSYTKYFWSAVLTVVFCFIGCKVVLFLILLNNCCLFSSIGLYSSVFRSSRIGLLLFTSFFGDFLGLPPMMTLSDTLVLSSSLIIISCIALFFILTFFDIFTLTTFD